MKKIALVIVLLMIANLTGCSIADTNPFEVKEARADQDYTYSYYERLDGSEGIEVFDWSNDIPMGSLVIEYDNGYLVTWLSKKNYSDTTGTLYAGILRFDDESGESYWDGGGSSDFPFVISPEVSSHYMRVSQDAYGNDIAYIAYSLSTGPTLSIIQLITLSDDGWGLIADDVDSLPNAGAFNSSPYITFDQNNNPVCAWASSTGGISQIALSSWNGLEWTDLNGQPGFEYVTIQPPSGGQADFPSIGYLDSGELVLIWEDLGLGSVNLFVAKRTPTGWTSLNGGPITDIYDYPGNARFSRLKIDDLTGNPYVIWAEGSYTDGVLLYGEYNLAMSQWEGFNGLSFPSDIPYLKAIDSPNSDDEDPPEEIFPPDPILPPWPTPEPPPIPPPAPEPRPPGNIIKPEPPDTGVIIEWEQDKVKFWGPDIETDIVNIPYIFYFSDGTRIDSIYGCSRMIPDNDEESPSVLQGKALMFKKPAKAKIECSECCVYMGPDESKDIDVTITGLRGILDKSSVDLVVTSADPTKVSASIVPSIGYFSGGTGFTSTLTLQTTSQLINTSIVVTINAYDELSNVIGTKTVTVNIRSYTIDAPNRDVVILPPGKSYRSVSFTFVDNYASDISATILSNIPDGLTITIDPNPMTPDEEEEVPLGTVSNIIDITFDADETIESGEYKIEISFGNGITVEYNLNVIDYDFTCYDTIRRISSIENSATWRVEIIPRDSFTGEVDLSIINLPDNAMVSYDVNNPVQIDGESVVVNVTITFTDNEQDIFTFTLNAESSLNPYSVILTVYRGNYTIDSYHIIGNMIPGDLVTYGINIYNFGDTELTFSLTDSGVPTNWETEFATTSITIPAMTSDSVLYEIDIPRDTTVSEDTITITVSSGTMSESTVIDIKEQGCDITVYCSQTLEIERGDSRYVSIALTSNNGYTGDVKIKVNVNPPLPWLRVNIDPNIVTVIPGKTVYTGAKITVDGGASQLGFGDLNGNIHTNIRFGGKLCF